MVGDAVGLPGIAAIAFAHGLTIMVFAFAYGTVSGGHMNKKLLGIRSERHGGLAHSGGWEWSLPA